MKRLLLILSVVLLQGCAIALSSYIPSFWDDNQSARIVDIELAVVRLDCDRPQAAQLARLRDDLAWFKLYSQGKGSRQTDVIKLTEPMSATVEDWYKRVSAEGYRENRIYCDLKRKVMIEQTQRATKAVLGRF
jgi:hypothetical protein